ncbi:MAG: hypothetical protein ABIQ88_23580 [Chitinophagaceae bacterium]
MMKHYFTTKGLLLAAVIISLSACDKNDDRPDEKPVGYLYTSINGEGENRVVRFSRSNNGGLSNEKSWGTGGNGGANVAAGGDAHGDFDAQGSVQIIGDWLLAVNAGSNQVAVFSLDRKSGDLGFKSNTVSGGTRPVSIAFTKKGNNNNSEYWVVVANQWNNPNVQKDGAKIERYPSNAFFMADLSKPDATDAERNIRLFSFNSVTGTLSPEKLLDTYNRENGGPTTVSFSDDGKKIAVSTWGIAHFDTQVTSVTEQHPSRVYIYDFVSGNISGRRYFEEKGIAGSIGFSWARNSSSKLYVSNFNLIPEKIDNSVTVLEDNSSTVIKKSNYGVTAGSAINEACWTALSPDGNNLYVASFQTNLVSAFSVNGASLSLKSVDQRKDVAPNGDSKELWVSPDGKFVYNLGAFQSFSINLFTASGNNIKYKSQTILGTTASGLGTAGKYNFLGLTGYDLPDKK